jgi:hypothetical protein
LLIPLGRLTHTGKIFRIPPKFNPLPPWGDFLFKRG